MPIKSHFVSSEANQSIMLKLLCRLQTFRTSKNFDWNWQDAAMLYIVVDMLVTSAVPVR